MAAAQIFSALTSGKDESAPSEITAARHDAASDRNLRRDP